VEFKALMAANSPKVEPASNDEGRHEGVASPEDQDFANTKRLGLRLVAALAQQMKATIETRSLGPGAEFVLLIPFEPPK
jgi:two-component sensor histidine kinase